MRERVKQEEVERWKRSIRELPEELFFSIMRTYLGRLSTPFHKHTLVEQLGSFLLKEETIRRIIELIDEDDARILTAVDLLDGAGGAELYRLLEDYYDYFTFHSQLLNLQERLLLYSDADHGALRLTPQLAPSLRAEVLAPGLLFSLRPDPERELTALSGDAPWLREELLWALSAFFRDHPRPFKHDGELRKKRKEEWLQTFPAFSGENGETRSAMLLQAAERLGIFRREEGNAVIERGRLISFAALPRRSRHLLLWAAAVLEEGAVQWELHAAGQVIGDLLSIFPEGQMTAADLSRLLALLSYRHRGTMEHGMPPERLRTLGLFGGEGEVYRRQQLSLSLDDEAENRQPLILHSDFTATAAAPLPFDVGLFLADLFALRMFTVYPQLELTKSSFTSCRKHFDSFEAFLSRLQELSASPLPPNIRSSLSTWEQNYSGVALTRGIVLQIDAGRKHLVEHNEALSSEMLAVLAEGVYLFRDDRPDRLLQRLSEAGIDPLPPIGPQPRSEAEQPELPEASPTLFRDFKREGAEAPPMRIASEPPEQLHRRGDQQEHDELLNRIQELTDDTATREALERLVRKKVIIFPSQLRADLQTQKMSEARGIDYAGKVRVIEETMSSDWDVLELVERSPRGAPVRHLLRPDRLQKMGNDLLLEGREFPRMEEVQLRVRKLSFVRRWRNSLVMRPEELSDR